MTFTTTEIADNAWHRQPAVWIVLGVLGFTVVSSFVLLFLAMQNPPQLAVEDYTAITEISAQRMAQDKRAHALGLDAIIDFDIAPGTNGAATVSARISSDVLLQFPDALRLSVRHSTLTALDATTELQQLAGVYTGAINLPDGPYDLIIEDAAGTWRLSARAPGPVARLELQSFDGGALN